jgi:hypothetical protein
MTNLAAILAEAEDLASLLWVVADAAAQRGDEDARRALRLLARHAEELVQQLEDVAGEEAVT